MRRIDLAPARWKLPKARYVNQQAVILPDAPQRLFYFLFSWLIFHLKRRTLLGSALPAIIEPRRGNVGMPQPLLHFGNVGVVGQRALYHQHLLSCKLLNVLTLWLFCCIMAYRSLGSSLAYLRERVHIGASSLSEEKGGIYAASS
jgi:hypothetical protein